MGHTGEQSEATQDTSDYRLKIGNCNSIEQASIQLRRGALNIKYGPNGIGKSTIAKALTLRASGDDALLSLTPFKYKSDTNGPRPSVEGADTITNVMTFNDDYVSTFAFRPDEVVKNSFEIFMNTDEYRDGVAQIESQFDSLKQTFSDEPEFDAALDDFRELRDTFNVTKGGALAKTSKAIKGIGVGGKLANIPKHLLGYEGFLKSDDPASWITWQTRGKDYLDLSHNCPFCSTPGVNKETAVKVSEEYNSAAVKNLSALRSVIDRLGMYFSPESLQTLQDLTTSISGLSKEQESFLVQLRDAVATLLTKLSDVKNLSFYALRDDKNVATTLANLKIDLKYLPDLNSEATQLVVKLINDKLDEAVNQIKDIKKQIGIQNTRVKDLIQKNQNGINAFLTSAGYSYAVRIESSADTYRMLLEHKDAPGGHIESAQEHLSYGEKNAFALVLFMHDVHHRRPDLVVLDDPVSSFDKTKKFAILHQLFRGDKSLNGRTTLLLTHDIEPAIDIVRSGTRKLFTKVNPIVHFLSGREGTVAEKPIQPKHINTFSQVCIENVSSATDTIIKCIYLRRFSEVHGARDEAYEVLSSLLHARDVPSRIVGSRLEALSKEELEMANSLIREKIHDFDYAAVMADLKTPGFLKARFGATDVGYEKVQLFRIMLAVNQDKFQGDNVFTKFVNETYHIENEYVMQLNPRDFDAVPEFVVKECTRLMEKAA